MFRDDDTEQGSGCGDPPRRQRRQRKCKDHRCDNGAIVGQGDAYGLATRIPDSGLATHAEQRRYRHIEDDAGAEEPDVYQRRRDQGEDHLSHDGCDIGFRRHERGVSPDEFH